MSVFFAWLNRLRLINRWGLMKSVIPQNDAQHSLQTAMISHNLALIAKERYGKTVDVEKTVLLAMYHDVGQIFTGDLPTPVKHHDPVIHGAYAKLEKEALSRLVKMLPVDLQKSYNPYISPDETQYEWRLVKAADRISAYSHCVQEIGAGNREFSTAAEKIHKSIIAIDLPEVQDFMKEFAPAFSFTLDELQAQEK